MLKKVFLLLAWIGCMSILMAGASQVGATSIDLADDNIIYRPSNSLWAVSENPGPYPVGLAPTTGAAVFFGLAGDVPLVGDVDGDGVDDIVVQRANATTDKNEYYAGNTDTSLVPHQIGTGALTTYTAATMGKAGGVNGNVAHFLEDVNNDGADDVLKVNANFDWKYLASVVGTGLGAVSSPGLQFGVAGDQAIAGDFNGDGLEDVGVYRPAGGNIFWSGTGAGGVLGGIGLGPIGQIGGNVGQDSILVGNLNGDAFDDVVLVRQDGVGLIDWFGLINDGTGFLDFFNAGTSIVGFGLDNGGDVPFLADIDGDGLDDIGITRGGFDQFATTTTAAGGLTSAVTANWQFGLVGDVQLFGDFLGTAIPEPTSLVLVVFGALGLVGTRRRRG